MHNPLTNKMLLHKTQRRQLKKVFFLLWISSFSDKISPVSLSFFSFLTFYLSLITFLVWFYFVVPHLG